MVKAMKIVSILLMVFIVLGFASNVFATEIINRLDGANSTVQTGEIEKMGNAIIKVISTVGAVIAVIVLMIIGVKYMMGSASEKAEYKKTMIPYLVGAVLIFTASTVARIVVGFAENMRTPVG